MKFSITTRSIIIVIALVSSFLLKSQDVVFSQLNTSNLNLNPALVGMQGGHSVTFIYRSQLPYMDRGYPNNIYNKDQWPVLFSGLVPKYEAWFSDFQFSLDEKIGLGIRASNYNYSKAISHLTVSWALSKRFLLSDKINLHLGLDLSYNDRSINWAEVVFPEQIDAKLGFYDGNSTSYNELNKNVYMDISSGIALDIYGANVGFSVFNLSMPNQSFIEDYTSVLSQRYSFHCSYNYVLNDNLILSPLLFCSKQGEFSYLTGAVTTKVKKVKFMLGYRKDQAIIYGLALSLKRLQLSYTYDQTLTPNYYQTSGGNHEAGVIFRFSLKDDDSTIINAL